MTGGRIAQSSHGPFQVSDVAGWVNISGTLWGEEFPWEPEAGAIDQFSGCTLQVLFEGAANAQQC